MRLLICGGRNADAAEVWSWLERHGRYDAADKLGIPGIPKVTCVIHGGARGADEGAGSWGASEGVPVRRYPAAWQKHGKAAGPMRNARMLAEGRPDIVIAFPGGRGTADMVRQAEAAGVPIIFPGEMGFAPSPSTEHR